MPVNIIKEIIMEPEITESYSRLLDIRYGVSYYNKAEPRVCSDKRINQQESRANRSLGFISESEWEV